MGVIFLITGKKKYKICYINAITISIIQLQYDNTFLYYMYIFIVIYIKF